MPPDRYFFGYIIDPANAVAEADEGNNAVGQGNRTRVLTTSPPNACMSVSPNFGQSPLRVTLNASCSNDPDGTITSYTWNMGDGGTRSGETASYTYYLEGSHTITLTVRDNTGQTDTAVDFVFVSCEEGDRPSDCIQ